MTAPNLTPYWVDREAWAGLLLLIVPATPLPWAPADLAHLVGERVAADSALYDYVTVAVGPPWDMAVDPAEWRRRLVTTLIAGAMPDQHLAAPRLVFTVVVVGDRKRDIGVVANALRKMSLLGEERVGVHEVELTLDRRTGSVALSSVTSIMNLVPTIITEVTANPEIAIDEARFLGAVARLMEEGWLAPPAAAPSVDDEQFLTVVPVTTATNAAGHAGPAPAAALPAAEAAVPAPAAAMPAPEAVTPAPSAPAAPLLPTAPPTRPMIEPIIHSGAEIITVENRKGRKDRMTDDRSIDDLAQVANAVSLAYMVFVPDDEPKPKQTNKRREQIALGLDHLLGTVIGDTESGRPIRVSVEVLAATSPMRKYGPLLPAGKLAAKNLPEVPYQIFDHTEMVDGVIEAARRSARAFRLRNVQVVSVHFIFLAAIKPATTAEQDWDRLAQHGRITWIDLDPSGPLDDSAAVLARPTPFGIHALSGRDDVVALVREQSELIYRYEERPNPMMAPPTDLDAAQASTRATDPPGTASDAASAAARSRRRWWPRSKRPAPPS